jgi:trafficking protein particle complex subunit 11
VKVDERAAYQITLTAPSKTHITSLPFSSVVVYFKDDTQPVIIRHSDSLPSSSVVQQVRLSHVDYAAIPEESSEVEAHLRWVPGGSLVLTGTLSSNEPTTMSVSLDVQKMIVRMIGAANEILRLPK